MEKERTSTHIKSISESFCKEIPDDIKLVDQMEILYWNLWSQFGITKENVALIDRLQLCLTSFTWSKRARSAFYKIEDHARVLDLMKKDDKITEWSDRCEPKIV